MIWVKVLLAFLLLNWNRFHGYFAQRRIMNASALILFAHGARDPAWANPMQRLQLMLRQQAPQTRVELAFLEFMSPDLTSCVTLLLEEGFREICILPLFIATGGHLKRDLPNLVHELGEMHPDVRFTLATPVGEEEIVLAAMAEHALGLIHGR